MDVSAEVSEPAPVLPGQVTSLTITVHNAGRVVERYRIEPLGDAAEWVAPIEPPTSMPGTDAYAVAMVAVPARAIAGVIPLGFAVVAETSGERVVEETQLRVTPLTALEVALVPSLSHGRRSARHTVAVVNKGNVPTRVQLDAVGDDLALDVEQPEDPLPPFSQLELPLRVAHLRRQLTRQAGPTPCQVIATGDHDEAATAYGSHEAASKVPRWTPMAVLLALALLLGLWAFVVSHRANAKAVQAAADAAAASPPISEQAKAINDLAAAQGKPAPLPPGSPGNPVGGKTATTSGSSSGGSGGASTGGALVGAPFDRRFEPGSGTDTYTVPNGKLLGITDLVLENAAGDQGRLVVTREGKVLFRADLASFRDQDTHLVTPLRITAGEALAVTVTCTTPGAGATACSAAALVSGVLADA